MLRIQELFRNSGFFPLLLIGLLNLVAPATALQVYSSSGWIYVGNYTDQTLTTTGGNGRYDIYKPICRGSYKLGDLVAVSQETTSPNSNQDDITIPPLYMCVDGPADEIEEANQGKVAFQGQKIVFIRVYSDKIDNATSFVSNGPLGQVGVNSDGWITKATGSLPGTYFGDETRGYGAFIHPNCKVEIGGNCAGVTTQAGDFTTGRTVVQWNGLQLLGVSNNGNFFQASRGKSGQTMLPVCLPLKCLCPKCENGQCLFPGGQCQCDSEWTGENCDVDSDECELNIDRCDAFADCINTSPGYSCQCFPGYETSDEGRTCIDTDECGLTPFLASCTAQKLNCTNTPGSFVCTDCQPGFVRLVNGTCVDATEYFLCGNKELNDGEECDRGEGCNSACQCSLGFSPTGSVDCVRLCGNGVLDSKEECDGGTGCLNTTCTCITNLGFRANNDTSCLLDNLDDYDSCTKYNSNCTECAIFNCLYCSATGTCSKNRISSDCLSTCGEAAVVVPEPVADPSDDPGNLIVQVVPAVVVGSAVIVAAVIVLVVLLRRKRKRKADPGIRMSVKNSLNTSKYGIERNALGKIEYKAWEPTADSEYVLAAKMPFEMSKPIDFNVGSNQFKVGQKYTDVITITARDRKSATTSGGVSFALHAPTTSKIKLEFNPSSGIVKKGKPVEVEVTMTMQMTTEIDVDIGLECSSEKKHSFVTLHLMSELSSFIDLEEVVLEGGSSAKPVGDGAFRVVYKGKYRGQVVAVKMLKVQDMPEEMLDEFDREVDLMNKLRHKNIVQFLGASKVVGRLALITEFMDLGNVANIIVKATKQIDFNLKLRFALDAARAMFFLHENKILHRDLKLDNLLCVSTNPDDPVVAKLTDFGTSRAVSEKSSNQYTVGVGTPMYMSPEILSKKPYDTKSDVYSYGMTLWILYCQKEPYQNIEHSWEVARFVIEGNREKIPKDCPAELAHLIEECWAQDPNQRPDFQHVVERLEKILHDNTESQVQMRSRRKSLFK